MAPKRRAASAAKAGGKKVKEEPKDAFTSAKEALLAAGAQPRGRRAVDELCPLASTGEVGLLALYDDVNIIMAF